MKRKLLVLVKAVPLEAGEVAMNSDFCIARDRISHQLNLADMAALEAAFRLRGEGTVTVLTMAAESARDVLAELLARGADRAVMVSDSQMAGADTYATAAVLAAAIRKMGFFDLILCGRRTMDGETGQVPGEVAAALGLGCITNASSLEAESEHFSCTRILEQGIVRLAVQIPAVVSFCEYAYPLRLPGLRARKVSVGKKVEILTAADLGLEPCKCGLSGSRTKVMRVAQLEKGLRKGPKETNVTIGAEKILSMIREKGHV